MNNFINRIRYVLMNRFGIKAKTIIHTDCEPAIHDTFTTLTNWACTRTPTVTNSRNNGVTLKIHVANAKGYVCPSIISHPVISYGNVSAVITTNPHYKLENVFTVRNKDHEWGFKIIGNQLNVVLPYGSKRFKLYNTSAPHKFTVDFDASRRNMWRGTPAKVYWRVDDITIYETDDKITVLKRVYIALSTVTNKIASKELPQSMNVASVKVNTYNDEPTHPKRVLNQ